MPDQSPDFATINIPIARNGINKDIEPTSLEGIYTPNMKNMVLEPTRVRKRLGYDKLGSNLPLSGIGMKLYEYIDARGNIHLIAITTTHVYEYQGSTNIWLQITPSKDLDECESGWAAGSGDTVAHDDTDSIRGSKSTKITLVAQRSDGDQLAYKDITSVDIDAHSHIGFWIKSSTALAADALEVVVSESNHATGEKTGTYVECLSTALVADTWKFVCLAKTLTDFDAVVSVSMYANATLASGLVIHLDDIRGYTEFTGSDKNRWTCTMAHDINMFTSNGGSAMIMSNEVDDLFYYEGGSGDRFKTLVHTYPSFANCKVVEEFWNHFMVINYNDGNSNVRSLAWADIGDIDEWVSGTSGATVLTDSRGEIFEVVKLGADLIFYSEHTITTCRYRGGDIVFIFPTLIYQTGLITPAASWGTDVVQYFLGTDQRVYKYAGGAHLFPVGMPIEKSLFAEADISKKDYFLAGYDPGRSRLYFAFARPSDDYSKVAYILNRKQPHEPWEYYEFADDIRSFSIFENQNDWYCDDAQWKDLYCDEVDLYCDDSYTQSGYPITAFISSTGYVFMLDEVTGKDDDANIECVYETQDITIDKEEHFGRWKWFTFPAKSAIAGGAATVSYSTDGGDSWTDFSDSPVTLTSKWKANRLPFDVVSRKVRFRLMQNSAADLQIRDDMHCAASTEPARD